MPKRSTLTTGYKILSTELTFWSLSPGSLLSAYILQFDLFKMPNLNRKRTSDSSSLWSISNLYRTSFSKQRSSGLSAKLDFKTVRGDCSISGSTSLTPNYMTTSFGITTMFENPSSNNLPKHSIMTHGQSWVCFQPWKVGHVLCRKECLSWKYSYYMPLVQFNGVFTDYCNVNDNHAKDTFYINCFLN